MQHDSRRFRRAARVAAALAGGLLLLLAAQGPALADDRDLLRFDSAKPYVFILLDTSASMSLAMGEDEWTPGWADGPGSRLYQAKQALYNVFRDVDDVHFGFASYNQDGVRVVGKHYIYYNQLPPPDPSTWTLRVPAPDLVDVDGDGSFLTEQVALGGVAEDGSLIPAGADDPKDTRRLEIGGHLLTFGTNPGNRVGGTCGSPLDLTTPEGRAVLQGLPINGADSPPTRFWLRQENNGPTYLLEVRVPGVKDDGTTSNKVGQTSLRAQLEARRVATCGADAGSTAFDSSFGSSGVQKLNLNLASDDKLFETLVVDGDAWQEGGDIERVSGIADFSDIVSTGDFSNNHPFTGKGWEGNYDSGVITGDAAFDANVTDVDPFCNDERAALGECTQAAAEDVKPFLQTIVNADGRALDRGDVLPFDWDFTWRSDMLRRFDPSVDTVNPALVGHFGVARHFGDSPGTGGALPVSGTFPPLVAADRSPLAKALNDVRCWYLGESGQAGSKKCQDTSFVEFGAGWEGTACGKDPSFGCRRPYLIVISDGEDTGGKGEDANADVGALHSHSGVRTWALNVGGTSACKSGGGLHPVVQAGKGECIEARTQEKLRQTLESILGEIRTEARSFASAAVPSVQATVEQKIFLTSFVPLNDSPVWSGAVHSFIKPLPTEEGTGRPNTELACSESLHQECHLWNAGERLHTRQYPASGNDYLDLQDILLRRVFYATQAGDSGEWPNGMRLFDPISSSAEETDDAKAVRHDLWRAFQLDFDPLELPDASVNSGEGKAEDQANKIVLHTLTEKDGTVKKVDPATGDVTTETIQFLMGDVFHSTPLVVGTPANTLYFAGDLYGNEAACDATSGTANPGYRCFVQKQRLRRKMLLVGSNDGMLHAFDAGVFRTGGKDAWTGVDLVDAVKSPRGSFDNGTGKELFAFVPRSVMPTLKGFLSTQKQAFTVDGTPTVADVFVDPVRESDQTIFPAAAEREWRTVAVGGLREGGRGYYALDITQPDPVESHTELQFVPITHGAAGNNSDTGDYVPRCTRGLTSDSEKGGLIKPQTVSGCGPVPFPAVLWEFQDTYFDAVSGRHLPADEEVTEGGLTGNRFPDLSAGWSIPNIGRIRICKPGGTACDPTPDGDLSGDDDLEDRFVAVFGGGMDTENKAHDWRAGAPATRRGNWLYMIDVETGEVLYKRALEGAAPSEPAAVDTDGDGYLDRIYIGTLAGHLYRVDLGPEGDALPAPVATDVRVWNSVTELHTELAGASTRLPADVWSPVKIFDANFDGGTASAEPRQIFHRPSVILDAISGDYLLAFGTGDREDLWTVNGQSERFFVFMDPFETVVGGVTALTEADLAQVDRDLSANATSNFLLTDGGWSLVLGEDERVITDAFSLSGLTIFSSFTPRVVDEGGNIVNVGCGDGGAQGGGGNEVGDVTCSKQGFSHIYVVNTTNANGLLFSGDTSVRYKEVSTFVTNPFAEPGQTKNTADGDSESGPTADDLTEDLIKVMESLKALFPRQCKFANYRVDVKTIAADTSLQFIAPVPVCIIERNWKEF